MVITAHSQKSIVIAFLLVLQKRGIYVDMLLTVGALNSDIFSAIAVQSSMAKPLPGFLGPVFSTPSPAILFSSIPASLAKP